MNLIRSATANRPSPVVLGAALAFGATAVLSALSNTPKREPEPLPSPLCLPQTAIPPAIPPVVLPVSRADNTSPSQIAPSSPPALGTSLKSPLHSTTAKQALTQPYQANDRLWPTLNLFMSSQGFAAGNHQFDSTGQFGMMGAWALLTAGYQFGVRGVSTKTADMVEEFYIHNLTLSRQNRFKPWTYITSAHTHFTPPHLLINALLVNGFAPDIGAHSAQGFLAIFSALALGSQTIAVGLNALLHNITQKMGKTAPAFILPTMGASGAVTAMMTLALLTNPELTVSPFKVTPPIMLLPLFSLLVAFDCAGLVSQCLGRKGGISHTVHIGGYLSGLLLYTLTKQRFDTKYPVGTHVTYGNWVEATWLSKSPDRID